MIWVTENERLAGTATPGPAVQSPAPEFFDLDLSLSPTLVDAGAAVVTPWLSVGPDHRLYVEAEAVARGYDAVIGIEHSVADDWKPLLTLQLDGSAASPRQRVEVPLGPFASALSRRRFRVVVPASSLPPCEIHLLRVCRAHEAGRINALSGYADRMRAEVQHFSGAAYTHAMYGSPGPAPTRQARVEPAAATHREPRRRPDLSKILEAVQAVVPVQGEVAYNYAMRALQALMVDSPPDFFARIRDLGKSRNLRVLSLCAGAARVEEQILTHCPQPAEIVLLDASPDLVARAAARLTDAGQHHRVECMVGDINDGLPGAGHFDVIVCVSALHHIARLEDVLEQVHDSLTPHGEFWSIGEQIGRNGNRLWPDARAAANAAFAALPERLRRNAYTGKVDSEIADRDLSTGCFEGVRSEELEELLERYLRPVHVYKRNAFLWRLVDATYSDNFDLSQPEDLAHLRALVAAEVAHWGHGGRSTELHGVYGKKIVT